MIETLFVLLSSILGGWNSRMCGGGKPKLPYGLDQWITAIPYGAIAWYVLKFPMELTIGAIITILISSLLVLASYFGAFLGKRTGHGQYIGLDMNPRQPESQDERLDFIVRFFYGVDRGRNLKRSLFGLFITGLAVSLVSGLVVIWAGHILAGLLVILGGAMKPLAYLAARQKAIILKDKYSSWWGEFLTGVFGWGTNYLAYLTIG